MQKCNRPVELSVHLLSTSHQYIMLKNFTTNLLQKQLGKLLQGDGKTNFISVQQILEKLNSLNQPFFKTR